jgi:hypothetical protein
MHAVNRSPGKQGVKMTQLHWLDDERLVQDMVLEKAEAHVRDLFNRLQALEGGFELLLFLATKVNSLMTVEDIAYFVKQPATSAKSTLEAMVDLGLARRADVVGLAFFGITVDSKQQQSIRDLLAWRSTWRTRADRIESVIDGKGGRGIPMPTPDRSPSSLPL